PTGRCGDARRVDLPVRDMQQALYACFAELGNRLGFEGSTVTRVDALGLLTNLPESERRKTPFLAFEPLWHALNRNDEPGSPYRRMIRQAAAKFHRERSPVEQAARTLGVPGGEPERWLERILDTWRQVSGEATSEPWDYRAEAHAGVRALDESIPV